MRSWLAIFGLAAVSSHAEVPVGLPVGNQGFFSQTVGDEFDTFNACIAHKVADTFQMRPTPSDRGFHYGNAKLGAGLAPHSSLRVYVTRSHPPLAVVYVAGGPWSGQDKRLAALVETCAGK